MGPKAVMLSHDNILFQSAAAVAAIPHLCLDEKEGDRILSYLPLSHVAGMVVDNVVPLYSTVTKPGWVEVNFARPYDLKAGGLGPRLNAVRPTTFLGVPRVWEKIAEKLRAVGAKTKGLKKKVATW